MYGENRGQPVVKILLFITCILDLVLIVQQTTGSQRLRLPNFQSDCQIE